MDGLSLYLMKTLELMGVAEFGWIRDRSINELEAVTEPRKNLEYQ
jgi:hypothetical protein